MSYHLPLFPLPEVVLFPRTVMSLHVFEPRYLEMMEAVMAGERRLGLAHLREGFQKDYFGAPAIYRTLTSTRILFAEQQSDGRWNIQVEGVERVVVEREIQKAPYRIAIVEPFADEVIGEEKAEVFELMHAAATTGEMIADHFQQGRRLLSNLVNTHQHPGIVCDLIASVLVADAYARQSILSEFNILRRLKLLNVQLQQTIQVNGLKVREQGVE